MRARKIKKNDWNEVRLWREELKDHDDYPVKASLEHSWEVLSNQVYTFNYDHTLHNVLDRESDERLAATPLDAFNYYIDSGFYPPPEILLWLTDCFMEYFKSGGSKSLEHIFFGREKPSVGNEAARRSSDQLYMTFSGIVGLEKLGAKNKGGKSPSQSELAEEFLNGRYPFGDKEFLEKLSGTDVETFLRNWRRWKKKADK
ncbi:hypothetical protein OPS25_06180 [Alteromonas ponticola]|uniref:Uncharacterized protein n=1 Tax=Alteromonas aquimaris TaxID=2998417 RepID=A0ABT3P5P8_9ALTE|nr:hypothetical protein [Alteromonas aquimaris]MCW8108080.1 hypothetical protein [Alteromonas aquimaris]